MVAAFAVDARGGGRLPDGLAYGPYEQLALPHWGGGASLERLKTGGGLHCAPRAPCANGKLSALGLANAWAGVERDPGTAEPAGAPVAAAEAANGERGAAGEPAGVPVFVMLPLDTVSAPAALFLPLAAQGHVQVAAFCHCGWCTAFPVTPAPAPRQVAGGSQVCLACPDPAAELPSWRAGVPMQSSTLLPAGLV